MEGMGAWYCDEACHRRVHALEAYGTGRQFIRFSLRRAVSPNGLRNGVVRLYFDRENSHDMANLSLNTAR